MKSILNNEAQRERVVVTGIGVVSPAGIGLEAFWQSILEGKSHIREHSYFPQAATRGRAAGFADFKPDTNFSWSKPAEGDSQDRLFLISETAINEALANAGINGNNREVQMANAGLYISSAVGPISTMETIVRDQMRGEIQADSAWRAFSFGRIAARLAAQCGFGGPYALLPMGCSGGCDAVGYGLSAIRSGAVDLAVVGGFEAPITPLVEAAFARIRATSSRDCPAAQASCPFDMQRDGFVLGEGGSALVLERESAALARGARPLGVVAGYGSVCSGFHMTDIHPSGEAIARSIELSLKDANMKMEDIDYANLHGSSTVMNDIAEANALRKLIGEGLAYRKPVTSLKSQIGHALAAASSIELAAAIMTLVEQVIPPTANLVEQDPRVGLDIVSSSPRRTSIRAVLKTASGFGGIHSAVVMAKYGV
ncbi:MAG TPA: beta-ketoacyl-[acyl-carrier-protein] synthase family protein [Pyrinomonadaceae bacterium]|jgi:3-oxoacyl-(acyl-carrier-protein) synthase